MNSGIPTKDFGPVFSAPTRKEEINSSKKEDTNVSC